MASVYGYCTVAQLKARSGIDYSSKLTKYIDGVVEAVISQGEREINTHCSTTFTGTIPDAIVFVSIELAYRRMYNMMIWDGVMDRDFPKKELMPIWDEDLKAMLSSYTSHELPVYLHRTYLGAYPYDY